MDDARKPNKDFSVEVKLGNIAGYSIENKFGHNGAVSNNQWDIVSSTSISGMFPASGTTVRIKAGGGAADTNNGAGARSITVIGIDATTFKEVNETIVTSGAGVSASTSTSFLRLYRAFVEDVGIYPEANTDDIVIEKTDGSYDMLTILANEGQTQHGGYSIASGKTGLLRGVNVWADGAKAADFRIFIRENFANTVPPVSSKRLKLYFPGVLGQEEYRPTGSDIVLPPLTDIWVEARGAGANTDASVNLEIWLADTPTGPIKKA